MIDPALIEVLHLIALVIFSGVLDGSLWLSGAVG